MTSFEPNHPMVSPFSKPQTMELQVRMAVPVVTHTWLPADGQLQTFGRTPPQVSGPEQSLSVQQPVLGMQTAGDPQGLKLGEQA